MSFDFDSPEFRLLMATAHRVVQKEADSGFNHLTAEERSFFLVWMADGEVENGGMHAVCYNSTGNYLARIPAAFRVIGSPERAALFEKLMAIFGDEGAAEDFETRIGQHESLDEAAVLKIDALDTEYYAAPDNLDELLFRLVQKIEPPN